MRIENESPSAALPGLRALFGLFSVCMLSGCDPIIDLGGAFFPGWLVAALGGLVGVIAVRQIFCWIGVEEHLSFRGAAYLGVFVMITVSLWSGFFLT